MNLQCIISMEMPFFPEKGIQFFFNVDFLQAYPQIINDRPLKRLYMQHHPIAHELGRRRKNI